jgi:hypothetical protein
MLIGLLAQQIHVHWLFFWLNLLRIVWHIGFTCGRVRAAPKATTSCDYLGNMIIGRLAQTKNMFSGCSSG